jgi:hypothetical protein
MTQGSSNSTLWDGVLSALQSPGGVRPTEPFSEQLQRVVQRHIAAEESSLARYRALIASSGDPVIRMLLTELVTDEEHHHGMLKRMEKQLEAELGERGGAPKSSRAAAMDPVDRRPSSGAHGAARPSGARARRRQALEGVGEGHSIRWIRVAGLAPGLVVGGQPEARADTEVCGQNSGRHLRTFYTLTRWRSAR